MRLSGPPEADKLRGCLKQNKTYGVVADKLGVGLPTRHWPGGRVARHRSAKPVTGVQVPSRPLIRSRQAGRTSHTGANPAHASIKGFL